MKEKWDKLIQELNCAYAVRRAAQQRLSTADGDELAAQRMVADALRRRVAAVTELNRATDDEQAVMARILEEGAQGGTMLPPDLELILKNRVLGELGLLHADNSLNISRANEIMASNVHLHNEGACDGMSVFTWNDYYIQRGYAEDDWMSEAAKELGKDEE